MPCYRVHVSCGYYEHGLANIRRIRPVINHHHHHYSIFHRVALGLVASLCGHRRAGLRSMAALVRQSRTNCKVLILMLRDVHGRLLTTRNAGVVDQHGVPTSTSTTLDAMCRCRCHLLTAGDPFKTIFGVRIVMLALLGRLGRGLNALASLRIFRSVRTTRSNLE